MNRDRDFEIRLADPRGDRDALGVLLAEMLEHYNPDRAKTPEEAGARAAVILGRWPSCEILIARREGRPLGLATFSLLFPAEGVEPQIMMKDLFVTRRARSQGIGEALLKALVRLAVDRGCGRLDWTTDEGNDGAQAFYERLGAKRIQQKVYYRLDAGALRAYADDGEGGGG